MYKQLIESDLGPAKIKRLLTEALEKHGDIELIHYVDFYYQEKPGDPLNKVVREKLTLKNLIDLNPTSAALQVQGITDIRDIIKKLQSDGKKSFPIRIPFNYPDSRERYIKMRNEELRKMDLEELTKGE